MYRAIFFLLLASTMAKAQTLSGVTAHGVSVGGQVPMLTLTSESSTASTIEAEFTTGSTSTPTLACGTASGIYNITAVDAGISGLLVQIVPGLTASTLYHCRLTVVNATGTAQTIFNETTSAVAASTPATSLTLGTISSYNSINASNQGGADTFYNAVAANGTTYLTNDDTNGFSVGGVPPHVSSSMSILTMLSNSPYVIATSNPLYAYGPCCTAGADGNDQKDSGMFTMGGKMFLMTGRQPPSNATPYIPQFDGQMIMSPDNGQSWNNFQHPTAFNYPGTPTSPVNTAMWGTSPTSYAGASFVMGCADDGTLGYTIPCNQTDNRDAYVYILGNDMNYPGGQGACGSGGDDYYLMRVPRAKMANLNPSDYQAYTGGDGNLSSNWTSTLSIAASILHECADLGFPNVQYIPAKNSYLMLTYFSTGGIDIDLNFTTWQGWTAAHPWGPWTNIYTQTFTALSTVPGAYNPVILNSTIWSGTTPTIMFTGNYSGSFYQMYLATLTIN